MYFDQAINYITTNKSSDTTDSKTYVTLWQSRGKSDTKMTPPISLTHKFSLTILNYYISPLILFHGKYLKTDTIVYPKLSPLISIYLDFNLVPGTPDTTITLANSLYGMMSFTKNGKTDPNEYTYSGCGVSFSSKKYTHAHEKMLTT